MTVTEKEKGKESKLPGTGGLPWNRLRGEVGNLLGALGKRGLGSITNRVTSVTDRLTEYAGEGTAKKVGEGGGFLARIGQVVKGATTMAKGAGQLVKGLTGKGKKAGQGTRVTNMVETIDIGAPLQVVYNQWTRFEDFPSFMKKVESVNQESPEQVSWKAQIFWSHRSWKAHIIEQVPDERIIWRSEGAKGYVDGAVTFHEIAPGLTRVVLVLEYHPKGFFEHTGNLWRAQGRRARLELKHFRRHVMTQTMLRPEEVEGWRGTIHEGQVEEGEAERAAEEREPEPTRS
ncbi:SRPBCC family protein [Acrocarpospora catenulata]|uniref:SRPBCC family protein n=1 Tax=Acrocarpospora catenulata TaxID=2836182 RepID=UPI001BDA3261|nr:SRPBCC family protein [Acrocarpospora catenulata]